MTPTFRIATPADAERLTEFMTRTFRETYSEEQFGDARAADVEAYVAEHFAPALQAGELTDPTLRTIVAESDGTLIGYAQLRAPSPTPVRDGARPVEIARFYVDRGWHGRGLARALMQACVTEARDAEGDADPLWLGVFERNGRARGFYEKCGFVPAGRATFVMGDDVQEDWILVLADRTRLTIQPPNGLTA